MRAGLAFLTHIPDVPPLPNPPSIVSTILIAVSLQASAWYPSRALLATPHTLTLNKNISVERWDPQI